MSGPADRTTRLLGTWRSRMGAALLPRTGIGATLAMNVYGGLWDGGAGGAVVAALYPVALVVSLETLVWVVRKFGQRWFPVADHWEMWFGAVTLGTLAGITGIISYLHALTVLEKTGSGHLGWPAVHLGPLVPDQLILTGTLALMIAARRAAAKPTRPVTEQTPVRTKRAKTRPAANQEESLAPRASAAIARAVEQRRIVNLVRNLDTVPGERALAADYCRGNRRLARDVLNELAKTPAPTEGDR
jgi:hypothetical protein